MLSLDKDLNRDTDEEIVNHIPEGSAANRQALLKGLNASTCGALFED